MKKVLFNVWRGKRRDGCSIVIQGPPPKASRQVWQVNHGKHGPRSRNWFYTRAKALAFARTEAKPCNRWEDIYIVSYPLAGAQIIDGQIIGHKNAEKS
jgi:hypothetical protein